MRRVAERIDLAGTIARCERGAGGVHAAARFSSRLGARRPFSGIGGLGACLVREERPAVGLCASSGKPRDRKRYDPH